MQTRLSTKGQVVLPDRARRKLGLRVGDMLDVKVKTGSVILTPRKKSVYKPRIIKDPITGFPVIALDKDAPVLTHKEVLEMLEDLP